MLVSSLKAATQFDCFSSSILGQKLESPCSFHDVRTLETEKKKERLYIAIAPNFTPIYQKLGVLDLNSFFGLKMLQAQIPVSL